MKKPDSPQNERARLSSLASLNILDTPAEERFDRIVRMTMRMFDIPVAFISLIDADRQWFKSSIGLEFSEIPRDHSICAHAIHGDNVFMLADAAADHRFADGPLVLSDTGARFYASCPLKLPNGNAIGTLCIIDHHPRTLDDDQLALLQDLAGIVEREFVISQLAITDDLTGIYNRQGFILAARHCLNLCVRQDLPATLAYLDLSELNSIRDRFGQAEGDRVVTDITRLLKAECRPSDIFARLHANEFTVLFINAPRDSAQGIMTRFHKRLTNSERIASMDYDLNFTYGIVEYDFKKHRRIQSLLDHGVANLKASQQDLSAA